MIVFRNKSKTSTSSQNSTQNQTQNSKPTQGDPKSKTHYQGDCKSWKFERVHGTSKFCDYQEAKIQELFTSLKPGHIPRAMTLILENRLVESCWPGDDVKIYGVLIERWVFPPWKDQRPELQLCIYVNNVQVLNKNEKSNNEYVTSNEAKEFKEFWLNKNPIKCRNMLIDSVAPALYARSDEKLGLLLSLIGGVPITGK